MMTLAPRRFAAAALLRDWLVLPIALLVWTLDQLAKAAIARWMEFGQSIPESGLVRLTFTTNTGSAFGLFPNQSLALIIASFLAVGALLFFYGSRAKHSSGVRLSIGLQLGGAFGNLTDRLARGYVVDFVHVSPWPVFNLADSAIVVGLILLLAIFIADTGRPKSVPWPGPPPEWRPDTAPDPGC
ncbi:MAG: signal peptidase II [Dehalococcoidia bacterium]|nr:signal peptidase II [Dehalococcoidia bacterium]